MIRCFSNVRRVKITALNKVHFCSCTWIDAILFSFAQMLSFNLSIYLKNRAFQTQWKMSSINFAVSLSFFGSLSIFVSFFKHVFHSPKLIFYNLNGMLFLLGLIFRTIIKIFLYREKKINRLIH